MTAWQILPRDADLSRSLDPITRWTELALVERYNAPDTWTLTGPADALAVFTPGMGCILDRGDGFLSGQVRTFDRAYRTDDDGRAEDVVTLGFIADTAELRSRLCWPDPAHALTTTPSTFAASHDTRTGPREDLILAYIADNLGPAAPLASRRLPALLLPASLGRGGTTTKAARMDVLADVVATLAEQGGLRVRIVHDESAGPARLAVVITATQDVSDDVVFGSVNVARATGFVTAWGYSLADPELTDAVVFSAGELTAREAALFTDSGATTLWGRRREVLVDQRQTDDPADIANAATEKLAEGATPVQIEFTVAAGGDVEYRTDYDLGDRLGVELPGLPVEITDTTLREAATTVQWQEAEEVSLVVGSPGVTSRSTAEAARLNRTLRRLALLERSR